MFRILIPYIKEKKIGIFIYQLITIIKYSSFLSIPLLISQILNSERPLSHQYFHPFILCILLGIVASFLSDFYCNSLINGISNDFTKNNLMDLLHAPYIKINHLEKASALSMINNCGFLVPNFYIQTLPTFFYQLLTFIIALIILLNKNVFLTLLIIGTVLLQYFFHKLLLKKRYAIQSKVIAQENNYKQNLHLLFKNWKSTKSQGLEGQAITKINHWTQDLSKELRKKTFWLALDESQKVAFSNLLLLCVILFLVRTIGTLRMHFGEYELFYSYTFLLIQSFRSILSVKNEYMEVKANYNIYFDNLVKKEVFGTTSLSQVNSISFENVSFFYNDKNVLSNKNLLFQKGNVYVLKGKNGSGKSTVFDLICGLYTPTEGKIMINDQDLSTLNINDYRNSHISLLEQKTVLLSDNPMDCITMDAKSQTYKTEDILKKLNYYFYSFSMDFLKNKESIESSTLSGGQLQKLGLVRSLYKSSYHNSNVLLFDEPFNHLDKETKNVFLKEVGKEKKNKITLIISHDNSFDSIADKIIEFI